MCFVDSPRVSGILGVFIEQRGGPGAPEVGTTHQGALVPPNAPWWVVLPSEQPPGASSTHWLSSGPKKSTKSFPMFGLRLVLISRDVENMQKTGTSTSHYGSRLVLKNDTK